MTDPLTGQEYWMALHGRATGRRSYPRPCRSLGDCELDHYFRKHLAGGGCRSIIEIGCGSSYWLPYFAREFGFRVIGLDYSPAGIDTARRNMDLHGVKGELICDDLFRRAELGAPRADAAVSLGFLEHFSDPLKALEAICALVNPGGVVFSMVPNMRGVILKLSCRCNPGLADTYRALDLGQWLDLHRGCGLDPVEGRYAQFFDWTWLNLTRIPPRRQNWISRFIRCAALPQTAAGRLFGIFPSSRVWGASIMIVARKRRATQGD